MKLGGLRRTNTILFFIFLIIAGLHFAASILVPLTFAIFFSTLVLPVSNFLEKRAGFGRLASSFVSTMVLFIGVGLLFFFLIRQLGVFVADLVERREEILSYVGVVRNEIMESTGFTLAEQEDMIRDSLANILNFTQQFVSGMLGDITSIILSFLLVLLYVFLLLINRDKFMKFIMMYISEDNKEETGQIINETRKVAHKYLWGRLQVMLLLGVLYVITFLSYGLPYTALLVIFGVLVTIIPYIGPFVSGVLPILFMVIFGDSMVEIVSFAIIVLIIQLIESYVFEPIIIGNEVQQSPLFVVLAIIIGGALWGAAGLILFVPIFGILKIIFDHSKNMKPVGFLIGYERPGAEENFLEKIRRKIKK